MNTRQATCVLGWCLILVLAGMIQAGERFRPPFEDRITTLRSFGEGEVVTVVLNGRHVTTVRRHAAEAPKRRTAGGGGPLINGDFSDGLNGWVVTVSPEGTGGSVSDDSGEALFQEGDSFLITLQQTFVIPEDPLALSFDLVEAAFDISDDFIPDAFEASLLDEYNLPVVPPWDDFATSYFNMQEDGSVNLGPDTTWDGFTATVDLSGVAPGTQVTLYFDFIGADLDTTGSVRIDNVVVFLDCNGNGTPDSEDIASGGSDDCNENAIPDECDPDCNENGVPEDCECQYDVDGDGEVRAIDLANLLGCWGPVVPGTVCECLDTNPRDGVIEAWDLANLLGAWGPCE